MSAYNAAGYGAFSAVDSFTTIIAVPAKPTLVSPVGTTGESRRTTFIWNSSTTAINYCLQIASANSLDSLGGFKAANVAFDTTLTDTSKILGNPLAADTKYYWHVSAMDTGGTSGYSSTSYFTTGLSTGVTDQSDGIPKEYALFQNFPNPFNPSTTIRFDLKQTSTVILDIYNMLGQRVLEENYGTMSAGRYEKSMNMNRFASGVYFYKIHVVGINGEKFIMTRKLMLMK